MSDGRVSISVMLRLAPEALAQGRLAGEVELVTTGDRAFVADGAQLMAFLLAHLPSGKEEGDNG